MKIFQNLVLYKCTRMTLLRYRLLKFIFNICTTKKEVDLLEKKINCSSAFLCEIDITGEISKVNEFFALRKMKQKFQENLSQFF